MLGKISVGVRKIAIPPITRISMAITTKVYGRRNANRTIHILNPSVVAAFRTDLAIATVVPERFCSLPTQTQSEPAPWVRPQTLHQAAMAKSRRLRFWGVDGMTPA